MTVLITGASGAIGQALARRLARRGERVLLTGRDTLRLEALASELGAAWLSADLTTEEGLAKLTAWAEAQGPADALAHCVGSTVVRPLHLTSLSDWRSQFEVNATTAFTLLKWLVAGALKAQRPARAVLVSSVVAEAGFANHEAIAAAKAAVTALALSTAATYAERGIRVNVVAPGLTRSPLTQRFIATPEAEARSAALIPSGRIGEPHEVAAAIDFLLLPEADHINRASASGRWRSGGAPAAAQNARESPMKSTRFKGNKSYLPSKPCAACGREMVWRKAWAKNWAQVLYCSERCRRARRQAKP